MIDRTKNELRYKNSLVFCTVSHFCEVLYDNVEKGRCAGFSWLAPRWAVRCFGKWIGRGTMVDLPRAMVGLTETCWYPWICAIFTGAADEERMPISNPETVLLQ